MKHTFSCLIYYFTRSFPLQVDQKNTRHKNKVLIIKASSHSPNNLRNEIAHANNKASVELWESSIVPQTFPNSIQTTL